MQREYTISKLSAMPTLCRGQTADLKVDEDGVRIWVSRCSIADGELDPVQFEVLRDGRWECANDAPPVHVHGAVRREVVKVDGFWLHRDGRMTP